MKRFLYILPIVFLFTGCNFNTEVTTEEEPTTEEIIVTEVITEETSEEVKENVMTDDKVDAFNNLNFSTTPANFIVDELSQYAIAYNHNVLTSIHPITGGKTDLEEYEEYSVSVGKGYIYVTPTIDYKTSNYLKIDDVMINIPSESVVYFSEPKDITFKGVRIQSVDKEGFLSVPVYTADGIMHNDGFDTTKYTKAELSLLDLSVDDANTFNPLIFDLIEPDDLNIGFDGNITVSYETKEEGAFYLYNDSVHSDEGSVYKLYKDNEVIYKGHLPGGCRMYVDFQNYDKIDICCGLLVPTK